MYLTERLPRETGRDYALRMLKDNIVRLELKPGSLVSENELAAEMGLSRTPVREALIELSKVKIVEIYPQRGSAIARIDCHMVEEAKFMRWRTQRPSICSRKMSVCSSFIWKIIMRKHLPIWTINSTACCLKSRRSPRYIP